MAEAATRRQPVRRLALTAGLLALSACSTVVPRRAPPPAPAPAPAPVQEVPVGPELPSDENRHRVALLVPLTGTNAAVGQSIANAANLAVLDTGGRRIRITTYDTAGGAAAVAARAVSEGNKVILGPLLAEDVRAVAPVASRSRVPVITFSNDTGVAGNGAFVMGYTPGQSIDRVVRYARSRGVTKFAGLVQAGTYGERAASAFLRSVEGAGGQVVSLQSYGRGGAAAAVAKFPAGSPYEAILIADSARNAAQTVTLVRRGAPTARVLGTELWNTETAITTLGALNGAWFASVSDNLYRQLAAKYRQRFGSAPYRIASMGYDSVLLVSRIAQDWRVGSDFPMARLTDEGGFTGIDGPFRFRRDGVVERSLEVSQVGAGGLTVVSAPPAKFED